MFSSRKTLKNGRVLQRFSAKAGHKFRMRISQFSKVGSTIKYLMITCLGIASGNIGLSGKQNSLPWGQSVKVFVIPRSQLEIEQYTDVLKVQVVVALGLMKFWPMTRTPPIRKRNWDGRYKVGRQFLGDGAEIFRSQFCKMLLWIFVPSPTFDFFSIFSHLKIFDLFCYCFYLPYNKWLCHDAVDNYDVYDIACKQYWH